MNNSNEEKKKGDLETFFDFVFYLFKGDMKNMSPFAFFALLPLFFFWIVFAFWAGLAFYALKYFLLGMDKLFAPGTEIKAKTGAELRAKLRAEMKEETEVAAKVKAKMEAEMKNNE